MTVNVTGWGTCIEQLEKGNVADDVQAILIQEHRIVDEYKLAAAVRAAKAAGWVADLIPAFSTDKGGRVLGRRRLAEAVGSLQEGRVRR